MNKKIFPISFKRSTVNIHLIHFVLLCCLPRSKNCHFNFNFWTFIMILYFKIGKLLLTYIKYISVILIHSIQHKWCTVLRLNIKVVTSVVCKRHVRLRFFHKNSIFWKTKTYKLCNFMLLHTHTHTIKFTFTFIFFPFLIFFISSVGSTPLCHQFCCTFLPFTFGTH